jgi:glycine dehydrogenase
VTAQAVGSGLGVTVESPFFDTVTVNLPAGVKATSLVAKAARAGYNIRRVGMDKLVVAFDETTTEADLRGLLTSLGVAGASR